MPAIPGTYGRIWGPRVSGVRGAVVSVGRGGCAGEDRAGRRDLARGRERSASGHGGAPIGGGDIAQRALAGREAAEGLASFAERMAGGAKDAHDWTGRGEDEPGGETRTMSERELLLGSSFHLSLGADGDDAGAGDIRWTAWGGASSSRFDGEAELISALPRSTRSQRRLGQKQRVSTNRAELVHISVQRSAAHP